MVAAASHIGNHGGSAFTSQSGRPNRVGRTIRIHRPGLIAGFAPEPAGSIGQSSALGSCGASVAYRCHWSLPACFVGLASARKQESLDLFVCAKPFPVVGDLGDLVRCTNRRGTRCPSTAKCALVRGSGRCPFCDQSSPSCACAALCHRHDGLRRRRSPRRRAVSARPVELFRVWNTGNCNVRWRRGFPKHLRCRSADWYYRLGTSGRKLYRDRLQRLYHSYRSPPARLDSVAP